MYEYSTVQPDVFLLTVSCTDSPIVGCKDFLQKAVGQMGIVFLIKMFASILTLIDFILLPTLLLT